MADYVLVDMFAEAVTGQASTDDAIANAAKRAEPLLLLNPTRPAAPGRRRPPRKRDRMAEHARPDPASLARLTESRNGLGLLFMLPAAAFLLCFLTYPLGLGVWLGFTDTKIGRDGRLRRARELPLAGRRPRSSGSRSSTRSSTPPSPRS